MDHFMTKILGCVLGASLIGTSLNLAYAQPSAPVLVSPSYVFKAEIPKVNGATSAFLKSQPNGRQKTTIRATGGKIGSGGGNSIVQVDRNQFIKKMKSEDIKGALIEYLQTISFNESDDRKRMVFPDDVKNSLSAIDHFFKHNYKKSNNLVTEIQRSPFTFGECKNQKGELTEASTEIGKLGARICFNLDLIYSGIKTNVNEEEVQIKLAAVLLHEVVHHFQQSNDDYEKNEAIANIIGQYFQEFMIQSLHRLSGMPFQLNLYNFLGSKPPLKIINGPNSVSFTYLNEPQQLPRHYSNGKELLDAIYDIQNSSGGTFEKLKKELQKDCEQNRECFDFSEPILVLRDPSEDVFVWMIIVKYVDSATGHVMFPKYQVFIKDSIELRHHETDNVDEIHLMDVFKKVELIKVKKFEI